MQNKCRMMLEDFDFILCHEQFLDMTEYADTIVVIPLETSKALYQSG
jgi:hypothetical protein